MDRIASCSCGKLTVACKGDPHRVSVCHCTACQKRTGSAFGTQARFRDDEVTVSGRSTTFERVGDEGGRISFRFCPTCGSTVYYTADYMPGAISVMVGAFGDRTFPAPKIAIYDSRRHPWVNVAVEHVEDG